ncbi:MAG: hypothetical protein ACI4ON_03585 [Clostridia bacterium]
MKKTMPKISFIILLILFVFSACMTVFATTSKSVTEKQNGLEATLNFNKQEYEANENVEITLNVKNNNSYAVKNIQTEIILPSTMKISTGSLTQEAFSLNAGESKLQEMAIEKVVETNNNVPTSNSPQTGDNVVIYIAMMAISASALIFIAVKKKWIHKKGVMSLAICFTLLGTISLTSVVNAEPTSKNFTVEGTIKYDGEDVVIKGKVTYMYELYSKVQIDGVDKGIYAEGDTVTITADEAPEGKHFVSWTVVKGNVTLDNANSSTTTFVMGNEDVEIKANYEVNTYTIEVTSGENGKVSPAGEVNVNYGDNKTFTITPNTGYHIVDVKVDGESKGAIKSYSFENVNSNHKLEVTFAINTYTITTSSNEGGTITGNTTVNYNGSTTLNITPNTGYHIVDVKVDGVSKGAIDSYNFENVTNNHTIDVLFSDEYNVNDEESLRVAFATGGIINLANDISITNDDVWVYSKVTINGGIYSINSPRNAVGVRYVLYFGGGSELKINNGGFYTVCLETGSEAIINDGTFDELRLEGADYIEINGGTFGMIRTWVDTRSGTLIINDGTFKEFRFVYGECDEVIIKGGTFYDDISRRVDTSTHTVTKTIDADGKDIWVVTEK